ncbi:unnamed protein product, partial [Rotaria magnacalcarata]
IRTICSSSWRKSLSFMNCVQPNDNDDAQQYVAYLSNIVHFPNVTKINFETIVICRYFIYSTVILLDIGGNTPLIFNQPFSRSDIIDKRRQAFGFNIIDEHNVTVSRNEGSIEIRLS